MGRKQRIGRRVERAMDFPAGTLADMTMLEVEGNRRVVVAGCSGILSYSEDCISLRTAEGQVSFLGRDLEMGCLSPDGATVTGVLQRIEFSACQEGV